MKNIITLCARRPVTMIMLMAAVFMGALYSFRGLSLNRLPEIVYPKVTVETAYPGMGAAEVRAAVTIPLEDSLSAVKGLEGLRSVSRDGASLVLLSFRWGTLPVRAAGLVREAVDAVYPGLPHGVSKPVVISGDLSEEPHAIVAVRSLAGDGGFARNLAEYELRSRLRRLDGAGRVSVYGGEKQEIRIRADPERLAARSLNGSDFAGMVAGEIADYPAGSAREGQRELTVVSSGRPRSEEEIPALILSSQSGPLRIGDLAASSREAAPRQSLFVFRNREQAALEIYRRPGADPVTLSKEIKKVIEESSAAFSRDAEICLVFDSSPSILRALRDLGVSGILSGLAVILILTLFMGRLSRSLLAVLALPFSASAAVVVLALTGRSLNSMSLGGLALGIGLVSDTSVIVLDLFCREFDSKRKIPSPEEAGALAASVALSSFAGALTTMIVFVPVIFLPGPLGALFGDLAETLIVSVAAGWFYAQFCLPPLFCFCAAGNIVRQGRDSRPVSQRIATGKFLKFSSVTGTRPGKVYGALLKKVLRTPFPVVAFSVSAGFIGLALLFLRPAEFITPDAVSEIEVTVDFPSGTSPESAVSRALEISETISGQPGISSFYGRMGAEDDDPSRRADPDYRKERLVFRCFLEKSGGAGGALERMREALKDFTSPEKSSSLVLNVGFPGDRTAGILGLSSALSLAVKGSTPDESSARAEAAAFRLRKETGPALASLRQRPSGTRPQLRLVPRREAGAVTGLSVSDIAASMYAASEGIISGRMEIDGRPLDIRISSNGTESDPSSLKNIPLSVSFREDGQNPGPVFLGSLVDIEWIEAETALFRQDRLDVIFLDIFPVPGNEKKIGSLIKRMNNPEEDPALQGISRADESVFVRYRKALAATVILVLLLLYLVLGAQFESLVLPLVLMLAIPFSLAGAGPALLLSGSSLDSGSVLGLVALFGLAVNNGIVLFEISEEKICSGLAPSTAVYAGALERFRPILLTSLTTIFALLPLVVSPLGNSQRGMASTMLGGIIVSGFLAFFALPPLFIRFLGRRKNRRAHD